MEQALDYKERIQKSNRYYEKFIGEVQSRSENRDFSAAFNTFLPLVLREKTIWDIGCGTGNHLKEFTRLGYRAIGIEPSQAMRDFAAKQDLNVVDGAFENLESLALPECGGIWCAASLLHVPKEDVLKTFKLLHSRMPQSAPLYFTVRLGDGAKWDKWDDQSGDAVRFIQLFSESDLLSWLSSAGFQVREKWIEDSTWGRPSKWISVVAQKS